MQESVSEASGSRLIQLPKEEEGAAKEFDLTDYENKVPELPKCPDCCSLITLYLQGNYDLTAIPPQFFQRMALLQVLDLSHTSIKSLPNSLLKLVALKKLLLQGCDLFMELSPQVGELKNLEELDLDETQIMDLPRETGKLLKLKKLKVSFYHLCGKMKPKSNILIHPEAISNLSQLAELGIDVNPADKRWDDSVETVLKEVCNSKTLRTLILYLPEFHLLDYTSLMYPSVSRFRFTVGRHKRRIISRVPHEVEAKFRNWDKCLKFVNGENIPLEIKGVLRYSTSFFLDHHVTAVNLSDFGIENMKGLKFCLLAECNEMETLIDGDAHYESNEHDQSESPASVEHGLESLEYLGIYYMENLRSIWRGPNHFACISKLKFIALHMCSQLSTIFCPTLLGNFVNLEEIILEDCPCVTSLVSYSSVKPVMPDKIFLPSLKRLLLLYLPELVSISSGLLIAPKLESIGCYNCPKLKSISKRELSSKTLKIIRGECQWWEDMNWNETEWGNQPDYLMRVFSPFDNEKDVMTQLVEDRVLLEATIQNKCQQLVNNENDATIQLAEDRCLLQTSIENEDRQQDNEKDEMTELAEDKDLLETPIENEGQQETEWENKPNYLTQLEEDRDRDILETMTEIEGQQPETNVITTSTPSVTILSQTSEFIPKMCGKMSEELKVSKPLAHETKLNQEYKISQNYQGKEERKTLDRALARAKVSVNRVATVVANEWKDANDKVMPVKQWLEERRFLQGEMQQLRDKLAITERAAKSEAQLKEKYHLRLKVLEENLRGSSNSVSRNTPDVRSTSNGRSRRQSVGGAENFSKLTSNGLLPKRSPGFQLRSSVSSSTVLKHAKGTSKSFDGGTRSLDRAKVLLNGTGSNASLNQPSEGTQDAEAPSNEKPHDFQSVDTEDNVPGVLYGLLQKEVIALRKSTHEKDQSLKDKDDAIEMLAKKVETLTKAMEVEAKKMRREVAAMEKEFSAIRVEKEHENRAKQFGNSKGAAAQLFTGRSVSKRVNT